jgi:hypothetical protein
MTRTASSTCRVLQVPCLFLLHSCIVRQCSGMRQSAAGLSCICEAASCAIPHERITFAAGACPAQFRYAELTFARSSPEEATLAMCSDES